MSITWLSWKNLLSRPSILLLNLLLISLGTGLIDLILHVKMHMHSSFSKNMEGIDMVAGAKGSPLQLILSSVYHVDDPTGNISLEEAEKLAKNPMVRKAIPLSLGDNYMGYRIVGTTLEYIDHFHAKLSNGKFWKDNFEVVVGEEVAKSLNLNEGDTFQGMHGFESDGEQHENHSYKVVGVLKKSGTVIDRLILCKTESIWAAHDHKEEDHHGENEKEITALLIKFRSPMALMQLPRAVNEKTNMQAAIPAYEISRLISLLGIGIETLW